MLGTSGVSLAVVVSESAKDLLKADPMLALVS
jgi:hypothetical protein